MSVLSTIRDVIFGGDSLSLPMTDRLGMPSAFGDYGDFLDLQDPNLRIFLQDGRGTATGVTINRQRLFRNSAANRAVTLITGAIGMLPLHLYELTEITRQSKKANDLEPGEKAELIKSEGATKAKDHPTYKLLHKKPNNWQTPRQFKSFMTQNALLEGTAFAVKNRTVSARTRGGFRSELIPLRTSLVEVKQEKDWRVHFIYHDPHGPPIDVSMEQMFWFSAPLSEDGVKGRKLLDDAAEALGLSYTAERATGRVLKNGAIVGGVLEHPKALDDNAINRLRTQFEERQSTPENAGKWIVAEDGLQAKPFGSTLKDAQNAELRKFQIEELGRFTGVPRPLLMMDETSWGTGIEQLGLFFILYCLMPWFVEIEEAVSRSLLSDTEQERYFAKFNEAALMRGSLKDQAEFFAKALGSGGGRGWMTQNEVRDKMNENPLEGGDELPQPITKPAPGDGGEDDNEGEPNPKPRPKRKGSEDD